MSPMKKNVSEAEMRILNVLWEHGPATAREVREQLKAKANLAYSTVITLLQRLEVKGAVTHTKSERGKAFVFHPVTKPEQVRERALGSLIKNYFDDDPVPLFSTLVRSKPLSEKEIKQLRSILEEAEADQ
ncbi:MAG: MarR family transcriptional regulator [bacterium]|nr:MarR family transcriptional regulator [bacterium]